MNRCSFTLLRGARVGDFCGNNLCRESTRYCRRHFTMVNRNPGRYNPINNATIEPIIEHNSVIHLEFYTDEELMAYVLQLSMNDIINEPEPIYDDCAICMESNCDVQTHCGHTFHNDCIQEWMNIKRDCPCCRAQL